MNYSATKYTAFLLMEDFIKFLSELGKSEAAKAIKIISTSKDGKNYFVTVIPTIAGEDVAAHSFEKGLLKGWSDIFSAQSSCPFNGTAYKDIPGYKTGFGCPVCKGGGIGHLTLFGLKEIKEAIAKTKKLKEGVR